MKQWTDATGADQTPDVDDQVDGYPHALYKDGGGKVVVETFTVTGKSHGTEVAASKPIDPANAGGAKCGKPSSYIIEAGICSTYYAARFFGLDPAAPNGGVPGGGSANPTSSSSSGSASDPSDPNGADDDDESSSGTAGKADDRTYESTCALRTGSSSPSGGAAVIAFAIAAICAMRRPARPRPSGGGSSSAS